MAGAAVAAHQPFSGRNDGGILYTLRWHHTYGTKVTTTSYGTTGWSTVLDVDGGSHSEGDVVRVHLCAHNPCQARWEASKYGTQGVPMHAQLVPAEPHEAVAETHTAEAIAAVAEETPVVEVAAVADTQTPAAGVAVTDGQPVEEVAAVAGGQPAEEGAAVADDQSVEEFAAVADEQPAEVGATMAHDQQGPPLSAEPEVADDAPQPPVPSDAPLPAAPTGVALRPVGAAPPVSLVSVCAAVAVLCDASPAGGREAHLDHLEAGARDSQTKS